MAIAAPQTAVATTDTGTSATISLNTANDELVLIGVHLRDETIVPTVSGNGLTFVNHADVDNTQGQGGLTLFRAQKPSGVSTGTITVSLPSNTDPVVVIGTRFTGADTTGTDGSGAVEVTATHTGPDPDDNDMLDSILPITDDGWDVGFGWFRGQNNTHTMTTGETALSINQLAGTSGDATNASEWYVTHTTATTVTVGTNNNLDSARDWAMITVSIKVGGLTIEPTGIASAEAFGTPTVAVGAAQISPTGIASAEAFGTPTVGVELHIEPTGIASAEAFGTPTVTTHSIPVPTAVTLTTTDETRIEVGWTWTGTDDLQGFALYRSPDGLTWNTVYNMAFDTATTATQFSYFDGGLRPRTTYHYKVRAWIARPPETM